MQRSVPTAYLALAFLPLPLLLALLLLRLRLVDDVHLLHLAALRLGEEPPGLHDLALVLEDVRGVLHLVHLVRVAFVVENELVALLAILRQRLLRHRHLLLALRGEPGLEQRAAVIEVMVRTLERNEVVFGVIVTVVDELGVMLGKDILVLVLKHAIVLGTNAIGLASKK